jgi:hypothetical protein
MLSKKSPRTSCRIRIRNNRIGVNGFLNHRCVLVPDLKSILRARMRKIVFRQHRPRPEFPNGGGGARKQYQERTFCLTPSALAKTSYGAWCPASPGRNRKPGRGAERWGWRAAARVRRGPDSKRLLAIVGILWLDPISLFLTLLQMYAYIFQVSRIDILDLAVVCFLVDNVPGFPHCVLRFAARVMKPNLRAL